MNAISKHKLAEQQQHREEHHLIGVLPLGDHRVLVDSTKIRGGFDRIDGEVRADDLTVVAIDTVVRFLDFRRVVSFDVVLRRKIKDVPRAKGDAVATAFAPFSNDVHDPA